MSFSADWLALREPADGRARNATVLNSVAQYMARFTKAHIVDLACGTGSTVRALSSLLPAGHHWTLCDLDQDLLDEAGKLLADTPVTTRMLDLDADLASAFEPQPDLVVTSAFLDLVSGAWLDRLIAELRCRKLPFYAALTYDGRASIDPPNRLDRDVIAAVNRHQQTDKGFGAALGPNAANEAIKRLEAAGFTVQHGRSDWLFLPEEGLVQSMMIDGWANAAAALGDIEIDALTDWRDWHLTRIAEGQTELSVGHSDLFAIPS